MFTDTDLEQLKQAVKNQLYINVGDDEYGDPNEFDLKALIARLEAAEAALMSVWGRHSTKTLTDTNRELIENWLKASGKPQEGK